MTCTNQRWLGLRLDLIGALLTFFVAILAVAARNTISAAQAGVVLSYILSVQQSFGWLVRQSAEVENDMKYVARIRCLGYQSPDDRNYSSVERLIHYATELEQEAPYEVPEKKPPEDWPKRGELVLKDVEMLVLSEETARIVTYAIVTSL
jgi:ABC-type multidrug transport system fused ATPase/permease subunit